MELNRIRILGIIGMIGAPWIFIDFINNGLFDRFKMTSTSGVCNFMFITGWMCSVIGLYQLRAMGNNKWPRVIMNIQLILLLLANAWNIYEMIEPDSQSRLFFILGIAWPVSGFFMALTGIAVLKVNKLSGWKSFMPLIAGLWFPFMLLINSFGLGSFISLVVAGIYATVAFTLLGFSIISSTYEPTIKTRKMRPV